MKIAWKLSVSGYLNKLVYGRPTPAALPAYARLLDIFKFCVSVCPIFPNFLSLPSETAQNCLNMVD